MSCHLQICVFWGGHQLVVSMCREGCLYVIIAFSFPSCTPLARPKSINFAISRHLEIGLFLGVSFSFFIRCEGSLYRIIAFSPPSFTPPSQTKIWQFRNIVQFVQQSSNNCSSVKKGKTAFVSIFRFLFFLNVQSLSNICIFV